MADGLPTIESLLKEIRRRGLLVNNLFHRMDGMWQANVRDRAAISFFEFGYGPDPQGALQAALDKADGGKVVKAKRTTDDDLNPLQVGIARHTGGSPAPAPVAVADDEDDLIG